MPAAAEEKIIAVGRYLLDPVTNIAEVPFVVHDQWQDRGIGTFLFGFLVEIARRNGIRGFTAEVLAQNKRMQTVFDHSRCQKRRRLCEGVSSYELLFS